MVSVTRVRISPDLSICTAYLSIFPSERGEELIQNITRSEKQIRYELGSARNKDIIKEIAERTSVIEKGVEELVEARKKANKIDDEHKKAIAYPLSQRRGE